MSELTEIALQMLGTIERMELIIPEITDTIRKALEEKAALATEPEPPAVDGEVAKLVAKLRTKATTEYANGCDYSAVLLSRAADLLERLAPQEPSDADLLEMWHGNDWFNEGATPREFISISRAVLARWSQP